MNDELDNILYKLKDSNYPIILIKQLAFLGSPFLLKKSFLNDFKKIFSKNFKMLNEIKKLKNNFRSKLNSKFKPSEGIFDKNHNIKISINNFCQNIRIESPEFTNKTIEQVLKEIREKIEEKNKIKIQYFKFKYSIAIKEMLTEDESKSLIFEVVLDKLINEGEQHEREYYNLLKLLYIENNILLKNAINLLVDESLKALKSKNSEDKNLENIVESAPFKDETKKILETDYRLSNLRYLIDYKTNYKNKESTENEQIIDILKNLSDNNSNIIDTKYYKQIIAPLFKLKVYLVDYDSNIKIDDLLGKILDQFIKISGIEKDNGGIFLAIKRGYRQIEEEKELFIIKKIGKDSDLIEDFLTNNSMTVKVFNGVKTDKEGNFWTNIEISNGLFPQLFDKKNNKININELYEFNYFKNYNFLFLRLTEKIDKPLGVLVFYKENNHFSPEEQRNLLLLKNELVEFLSKHYENYNFEELIKEKEKLNEFRENIDKFRHGAEQYSDSLLDILEKLKEEKDIKNKTYYIKALKIQANFIKSKWTLGNYYANIYQHKDIIDKKGIIDKIKNKNDSIFVGSIFLNIKNNLEILKEISNHMIGEYLFPIAYNFNYHIDGKLLEISINTSLGMKLNQIIFEAIVWEIILNHLKHAKGLLKIIYNDENHGLKFISENKREDKEQTEGYGIGIDTIKTLLELIGGACLDNNDNKNDDYILNLGGIFYERKNISN